MARVRKDVRLPEELIAASTSEAERRTAAGARTTFTDLVEEGLRHVVPGLDEAAEAPPAKPSRTKRATSARKPPVAKPAAPDNGARPLINRATSLERKTVTSIPKGGKR